MNLIPNNDNNSNSNNNGGWGQPSNNSVSNRNWEVESNENSSQWMLNSNHNSISNTNASNIINANNSSQVNQSDDLENASLINECATMPKNWSQVVENNTSSTSNIETQPQTNVINVEPIKSNMIKDDKFTNLELFSSDWGTVPINQNIRWNFPCPSNYQPPPREVQSWNGLIDNSWKFSSSTTGTDIWEANIRKKATESPTESVSSQTKNAQNWNNNSTNHLGGTWGEEENFSKMWNNPASTNGNTNTTSINNNWVPENDKNQGWSKQMANTEEKVPTVNGNTKEASDTFFSTWDSNSNSVKEKEPGWNENDSVANNDNINDDGTALWNNSRRQSGNGRWKEENDAKQFKNNMTNSCANGNNAHMQNNGFPATSPGVLRIPSTSSINEKNNWNKNQLAQQVNNLKNKWNENPGNWNGFNKNLNNADGNGANGGNPLWNESASPLNWNKTNNKNGSNWPENQNAENADWMSKFKKELILQSHQFKVLYDMGFRKENIETALKNCNMNIKEATDELRANVLKENSNDIDRRKNSGFNQSSSLPLNSSINNRNTSQFNQMSQQQHDPQVQQQQHDPQVQQQPNQMFRNNNANNNVNKAPNTANAMLSDKRLGNLVQQIQLAVQSGHLNAQILNQPLSVNTIQLIYQLLQQIKFLQTLQLQSTPNMNKNIGSSSIQSDINVQITQVKQRISSLQNQIKVQQTIFINQHMNSQQSVPNPGLNGLTINPNNLQLSNSEFKNLVSPDSTGLTNEFRDLQLNQQNQSRLSTWKNNNFDKDLQVNSNNNNSQNFSRAPGSIKGNLPVINNNNWSGFANDPWMNEENEYRETVNIQQNSSYMNESGIPEFQPGKPWKGTQIKNSEDDPHLTPGSVNRSILSLNNLKDQKAYYNNWSSKNNNSIGNNIQPNNIPANNTWSFNNGNMNSPSWNGFNNESSSPVESLWQGGAMPKVKGPPPGLSPNKSSKSNENNWDEANVKSKGFSSYLLLKNLTPQIDASTLRTLCMQHGPLQMFNFLNNGLALVKYKSKEEAIKAQSALNNCYLSNTTILVDFVSENEVQQYISGQQTPSNSMNWNNNSNSSNSNGVMYRNNSTNNANGSMMNGANSWQNPVPSINSESQWTFSAGNLWNSSMDHNASPMQNLLPGDLLNGESV